MIVCIPSKNRADTQTYKLFEGSGIRVYHFVEPQEIDSYPMPNKVSIEQNNQGISYVRNFILDWARENNHEWILMCDDDIKHFGIYNGKSVKTDANIWHEILAKAQALPFEMVGIQYRQHAWHEKKPFSINKSFVEVCVLINAFKCKWRYENDIKEDRDFVLQTIAKGNGILKLNRYFYDAPVVGTNAGGLQELYANKKDGIAAEKFVRKWHPYAKLVKKDDRVDIKVDIPQFALSHGKKVVK
jgi:glycosyltransferase involved in cell wall biosynthesis